MSPKRKPRRMPCFTHALTRQPLGDAGAGSADRTVPASRAAFSSSSAARAAVLSAPAPAAARVSMVRWSGMQPELLQESDDLLLRGRPRRHHGEAIHLVAQS